MPLKSAELHRLAREELGPLMTSAGFTRTQGTSTASWVRPMGERWLVMWVQPSQWNDSYSPGFRFTVELRLSREPIIGGDGPSFRLAQLLTDNEREELRQLENRAIAKLPPPDPEWARMLPAGVRERWLADWKPRRNPYGPQEDVWFRHIDGDDARALMTFFKRTIPGAIERFGELTERASGSPFLSA